MTTDSPEERLSRPRCGHWLDGDVPKRCGAVADFILWGKLFPLDAFGPRCRDHAELWTRIDAWTLSQSAIYDLRPVGPLLERLDQQTAEIERLERSVKSLRRIAEDSVHLSSTKIAELAAAQARAQAALAVLGEWERKAGPGSTTEQVFGRQVVSVKFAVDTLRAALAARPEGVSE